MSPRQKMDLRGDLSRYPVDASKIPLNMPVTHFHLVTTGHLMAFEHEQYGFGPPMKCTRCQGPVDLIWRHKPVSKNFFVKPRKGKKASVIPGAAWGSDVTVICRCCSFEKCPHKKAEVSS